MLVSLDVPAVPARRGRAESPGRRALAARPQPQQFRPALPAGRDHPGIPVVHDTHGPQQPLRSPAAAGIPVGRAPPGGPGGPCIAGGLAIAVGPAGAAAQAPEIDGEPVGSVGALAGVQAPEVDGERVDVVVVGGRPGPGLPERPGPQHQRVVDASSPELVRVRVRRLAWQAPGRLGSGDRGRARRACAIRRGLACSAGPGLAGTAGTGERALARRLCRTRRGLGGMAWPVLGGAAGAGERGLVDALLRRLALIGRGLAGRAWLAALAGPGERGLAWRALASAEGACGQAAPDAAPARAEGPDSPESATWRACQDAAGPAGAGGPGGPGRTRRDLGISARPARPDGLVARSLPCGARPGERDLEGPERPIRGVSCQRGLLG